MVWSPYSQLSKILSKKINVSLPPNGQLPGPGNLHLDQPNTVILGDHGATRNVAGMMLAGHLGEEVSCCELSLDSSKFEVVRSADLA